MENHRQIVIDEILKIDPCANMGGKLNGLSTKGLEHKLHIKKLWYNSDPECGSGVLDGTYNVIDA